MVLFIFVEIGLTPLPYIAFYQKTVLLEIELHGSAKKGEALYPIGKIQVKIFGFAQNLMIIFSI